MPSTHGHRGDTSAPRSLLPGELGGRHSKHFANMSKDIIDLFVQACERGGGGWGAGRGRPWWRGEHLVCLLGGGGGGGGGGSSLVSPWTVAGSGTSGSIVARALT